MSTKEFSSHESPIQYSEVLVAVLAALAIEQSAQSLFEVISNHSTIDLQLLRAVALSIIVIITTIRFYHGNSIYLSNTYSNTPYNIVLPGSLIVASLAHFIDLFVHMLQYLILVGCATCIVPPKVTQNYFGFCVLALYCVDLLWILLIINRNKNSDPMKTLKNWAWINFVSCVFLCGVLYLKSSNFFTVLILVIGGLIDYCWNFEHYFSTNDTNDPKLISLFHAASMTYLTISETIPSQGFQGNNEIERFNNYCKNLFLYFMENSSARKSLFLDPNGKFHVGIYFEKNGYLHPVFRYHDEEINITNRVFARGESYVGDAFNNADPQNTSVCYNSRQDEKVFKTRQIEQDQKNYNSGVLAQINFDDGKELKTVGILNITSSNKNSFVDTIHNLMFKNIAQKIALSLNRDELKGLLEIFKTSDVPPFVVKSKVIRE